MLTASASERKLAPVNGPCTTRGSSAHAVSLSRVRVAGLVAALVACHGAPSSGVPCNEDPWQCPTGETCWPKACVCPSSASTCNSTDCTPQFECLPSRAGASGDACQLTIGQAACADGLTCVVAASQSNGQCRPYCDPIGSDHACSPGSECETLWVGTGASTKESVCLPAKTAPDASLTVDGGWSEDDAAAPPAPEGGTCAASSFVCSAREDACAVGFCTQLGSCCTCE
jgi:hypothetical protein